MKMGEVNEFSIYFVVRTQELLRDSMQGEKREKSRINHGFWLKQLGKH